MAAVPFIGSRISLISRSDIRYEGILVHIDPQESTVYLSNGSLPYSWSRICQQTFASVSRHTIHLIFAATVLKELLLYCIFVLRGS
jgi:hypothetical protein